MHAKARCMHCSLNCSMALLVTSAVLLVAVVQVIAGCGSGFMQLDVLRKRAEKVSGGSEASSRLNNELRLMPDWSFSCSGTITSFLLGVDVRTIKNNRNEYPVIQLWRRTNSIAREYTKMNCEEIRLYAGNYTASGLMQYQLSNSGWQYQSGDILGIYQPTHAHCVVRIFYKTGENTAPDTRRLKARPDTTNTVDLDNTKALTTRTGELILITPVSDNQCLDNFLSPQVLQQKTLEVNIPNVLRRDQEQRIFPDIKFTCSGHLTKWIVGGKVGKSVGAEVQIWRRNTAGSGNDYTKVGYSVLDAIDADDDNVYEYIPNPPLEFQEGDILGVYQQSGGNRMSIYYQETTGPANYRLPGNINTQPPVSDSLTGAILVSDEYDYPLVTVEIIINTATTSVFFSSTPLLMMSSSTSNMIVSTITTGSLPMVITTTQQDDLTTTSQAPLPLSTTSVPMVTTTAQQDDLKTTSQASLSLMISTTTVPMIVTITPLQASTVATDESKPPISYLTVTESTSTPITPSADTTTFISATSTAAAGDVTSPVPTTSIALMEATTVLKDHTSTILNDYTTTILKEYTSTVLKEYTSTVVLKDYTSTVLNDYTSTVINDYTSTIAVMSSGTRVTSKIIPSASSAIQTPIVTNSKLVAKSTTVFSATFETVTPTPVGSSQAAVSVPHTNSAVTSNLMPSSTHTSVLLILPTTTEIIEAAVTSLGITQSTPTISSTPVETSTILQQGYSSTTVYESSITQATSPITSKIVIMQSSSSIANQNPIITSSKITASIDVFEITSTTSLESTSIQPAPLLPSTTASNAVNSFDITQLVPTSSSVFMENPSVLQQTAAVTTSASTPTTTSKIIFRSSNDVQVTTKMPHNIVTTSTKTILETSRNVNIDSTNNNQPMETVLGVATSSTIISVISSSPIVTRMTTLTVTTSAVRRMLSTTIELQLFTSTQQPTLSTSTLARQRTAEPVVKSSITTRIVVGTPDIAQGPATVDTPFNIVIIFGVGIGTVIVLVLLTLCIISLAIMVTRRVRKNRVFTSVNTTMEKMAVFENPLYCDPQTVEDSLKRGVTNPVSQEFNSPQPLEDSFGVTNPMFELDNDEKD